jgi:hypothetical protein
MDVKGHDSQLTGRPAGAIVSTRDRAVSKLERFMNRPAAIGRNSS